jgi:hypothetical protein
VPEPCVHLFITQHARRAGHETFCLTWLTYEEYQLMAAPLCMLPVSLRL